GGTFTATSTDCAGIATFSAAPFASSLQVTPTGAGTCTIHISDTNGGTTNVPVGVTITSVGGS
ncbi:MAG: hypothetical protein JO152_04055, partial [Mycobacteriaceae bacterium]|nr:hypothetical protein [Mycobacteriaceae bacterium]